MSVIGKKNFETVVNPSVAGAVQIQDLFLRFPNLSRKAPCKFWIWVTPPPPPP